MSEGLDIVDHNLRLEARIRELERSLTATAVIAQERYLRIRALEAALTPSAETKAAYMGEHQIEVETRDADGEEDTQMVIIPWTTTKDIMGMILKRAALACSPPSGQR